MNLIIVPGIFISFLISVCMLIASKALLISSATVIVRTGGSHLVEPPLLQCYLVCVSAVTVDFCVFVPVLHGCIWYVCCYVRKKALLQCLCNY